MVAGLALRELSISFRLVALLAPFILAGALVALLPAPPATALQRLSIGLGAAIVVVAGVAAWSMATERRLGRAGWLVSRAVGRGTLVLGWFVGIMAVALLGLLAASVLGWITLAPAAPASLAAYAAIWIAIAATCATAAALGLLAGSILPVPAAVLGTVMACVGLGAVVVLAPAAPPFMPGGGNLALASLPQLEAPIGSSFRSAGVALLTAAFLVALARTALERAEL